MKPEPERNAGQAGDPLDELLLEAATHVDDAGFTARVMQALPARRSRRSVRSPVLTLTFALCCLIGLWALPPIPMLFDLARFGFHNPQLPLLLVFLPVLCSAAALAWTLYALTSEEV
jgi:hypothetical protein